VRRLPNLNEKLWQVIAALRATEMPITVGEHTESMWVIPLNRLDG
jgi:hypothetical protein